MQHCTHTLDESAVETLCLAIELRSVGRRELLLFPSIGTTLLLMVKIFTSFFIADYFNHAHCTVFPALFDLLHNPAFCTFSHTGLATHAADQSSNTDTTNLPPTKLSGRGPITSVCCSSRSCRDGCEVSVCCIAAVSLVSEALCFNNFSRSYRWEKAVTEASIEASFLT